MAITLSILLGLIALWWALRFLPAGADGHGLMPYLIAFVRFLWIPSIIILAVALISRHWIVAVIAAILTILTGVFASPWYRKLHHTSARQNPARQASQDKKIQNTDIPYTVMTLNCRYGHADPQAIIDAVRNNDVSILALQELTPELVAAIDNAGMNESLPYRQFGKSKESDNGGFNAIFSRTEPDAQAGNAIDIAAADVPYCEINGVAVYSVHPKSPMRGCKEWSQGIRKLAELMPKSGSAIPQTASSASSSEKAAHETIIMGDLNSNLDHPSFRKLSNAGFEDAGLTSSHTRSASFPQWLVWPRLELDHILVTPGLATSNVHTLAIPGSDHFALLAQLRHL
ncbi:endonuclease/exonuclease/phosphatase family protein [Bifidobacterium sp. ESL0732]|uniref:endonuclease/exonuclease/phosphatase family protein n=1 Tax=Bifidobacterium sp. ESL0732 TaxID=2983222 RepID=UPI0023F843C3|nr:endonuclease/exonuclease/phosphatase family protein [Bifidobacterium sp. ESL0732]WEV63814.1 endonuclease/exonuclease/phosphatase family protein [Bifidobacterium sp. ESL0732]